MEDNPKEEVSIHTKQSSGEWKDRGAVKVCIDGGCGKCYNKNLFPVLKTRLAQCLVSLAHIKLFGMRLQVFVDFPGDNYNSFVPQDV